MPSNELTTFCGKAIADTIPADVFRLADLDLIIRGVEVAIKRGAFNAEEIMHISSSVVKAKRLGSPEF